MSGTPDPRDSTVNVAQTAGWGIKGLADHQEKTESLVYQVVKALLVLRV